MALLQDSHKELKLPTRPLVLGRLASQPCLFAESTRMPRRGSSAPNSGARSDEWRNSGGGSQFPSGVDRLNSGEVCTTGLLCLPPATESIAASCRPTRRRPI